MSKIKIQNLLPNDTFTCFIVNGLFSTSECDVLLSPNIKNSFQKAIANYPTNYRNNDRFVIDSNELAEQLFQKVKPHLPETIEIDSSIRLENGIWHLKELNNRLRYCKYSSNQFFSRHLDGIHYRNQTTQSKLTFMIYLNDADEFEGGRTLFYKNKESEEIWAAYVPRKGDLIVFDHNVWHEAETLESGEKFVLRSDILYSKKAVTRQNAPFEGHLGYIWALLVFNENTILSGGRDKVIKVWNKLGEQITNLTGHQNSILCIEKMNPDIFISGSRDQKIVVWKDFKIYKKITIHKAVILSLCRINDEQFASSSGDNTIKISTLEGHILKTFSEHTNWVWQVIKLEENTIASCSEDHSIKIWNMNSEKSIQSFYENNPVISIDFNMNTMQLISGNLKGEITLRTLDNNYKEIEKTTIQGHAGTIRIIKFINNNSFTTGGEDNKVKIWNCSGKLISEFEHDNFVQSVALLDERTILSAAYDGRIQQWSLEK